MAERVRPRRHVVRVAPLVLVGREPEGHCDVTAQAEAFGGLEALYPNTGNPDGKRLVQRIERLPFPSWVDGLRPEASVDGEVLVERTFEIAVPNSPAHV